jgi:asparagine synthase (glutamine-hydrolysing)
MDPVALDLYLHYQYIPAPYTIYQDVKKLAPAEFIELDLSSKRLIKINYWGINTQSAPNTSKTMGEWMENLDALLQDAVKIRLISDVPFGAFLSGGVDSGLVVAMMAGKLNEPVNTFSIGLADDENDELPHARMIANRYGTKHEEFKVAPEGLTLIPKISKHFGEPFADSSAVPTYYVSQIASSQVKMVLTGDGGDEMFAGYRRYSHLINVMSNLFPDHPSDSVRIKMWKRIARGASRRIPGFTQFAKGVSTRLPSRRGAWQAIYDESVSHFSLDERARLLGQPSALSRMDHFTSEYPYPASDNMVSEAQYCDLKSYLPGDVLVKVDRMSMAHSLEVRSPLLDYRIAELAFCMPTKMKIPEPLPDGSKNKFILKELASRYLGRDYVYRPKEGFVIPISRWLREDRSGYLRDTLAADSSPVYDHLNKHIIQGMINAHRDGSGDYGMKLWNLLMLDGWLRYAYTTE